MSYLDRLRPCNYTSPSGKAFTLFVDQIERSATKKAAIHELAGADGAIVQDQGRGAKRYPLSCYIVGPDYDQIADAFAAALDERYTRKSPGKLQHPRWGDLDVCPLSYLQAEDLVDETRLARFQVDFVNAPEPSLSSSATSAPAIQSAADAAAKLNVADIAAGTALTLARLRGKIVNTARSWTSGLRAMKNLADTVKDEITALGLAIERGADELVTAPLDLCNSLTSLARLPARAAYKIDAKIAAYADLIETTLGNLAAATAGEAGLQTVSLSALYISSVESATEGSLACRESALSAARSLARSYASIISAVETAEASTGFVAPPDLLASLATISANAQAYLLDQSFSLRLEHRIILSGDRHPLELIREIHGEVDDIDAALDAFYAENPQIKGDAMIVAPRGTEVRYYA